MNFQEKALLSTAYEHQYRDSPYLTSEANTNIIYNHVNEDNPPDNKFCH